MKQISKRKLPGLNINIHIYGGWHRERSSESNTFQKTGYSATTIKCQYLAQGKPSVLQQKLL